MSSQFNMTNGQELGQERLMWGISNSDNWEGGCRKFDTQPSPSQPSHPGTAKTVAKGKKRKKISDENDGEESPQSEIHISTERERRKKMRDNFAKLHAMLPQLPPKADKAAIVDEAVRSIKTLEQTLWKLQMQKLNKLQYSPTTFAYDPSSSSSPTPLLIPITNHPQIFTEGAAVADSSSSSTAALNLLPNPCHDPIVAFDTWISSNVVLNICGNEAFFNLCFPRDRTGVFTSVCYLFEIYHMEVLFANVSSNVFRSTYMIQAQVNSSYENLLLRAGIGVGEFFKLVAQELVSFFSPP